MHTLPDDDSVLDYHDARRILAGIVKTAVLDWRRGVEPDASEAAAWLDEAVGHPDWRKHAASMPMKGG